MAYALDSSKRKFHRILDSISNSSNLLPATPHIIEGSTSVTVGQPLAKRRRIERSQRNETGVSAALLRNGGVPALLSTTKLGSTAKAGGGTMAKTRLGDLVTPYAPTMRSDFLLRLKTFSIQALDKWSLKPDCLNEVQWAKRGWVLEEKETVRCTCCSHRHVLKYNEQEAVIEDDDALPYVEQELLREQAQDTIATRWAELIVNGHSEKCPWRVRGCDGKFMRHPLLVSSLRSAATIYRLPVNHPAYAIPLLKARYESVLAVRSKLPGAQTPSQLPIRNLYEDFRLCAYGKDNVPHRDHRNEGNVGDNDMETARLAFCFALFGWEVDTARTVRNASMVSCNACFRRVGLWIWPVHEEGKEPIGLCPVADEHRWYCPWGNGVTQNEGAATYNYYEEEDTPAWQQLVRFLEKAGRSLRYDADSTAVDVTSEPVALTDGNSTAVDSTLTNSAHEHRLRLADRLASAAAAEACAAEDQDRIGRWQRLKQRLAMKPKTTGPGGVAHA